MKKTILSLLSVIAINTVAQVVPNVDWVRYYSEKAQISNVPSAIDANNNVYITGYTYVNNNADVTTIKYDAQGVQQWVKHYDNGGFDDANAITLDATGNVYVVGYSDDVNTRQDIITIKYDANGTELWKARFNNSSANQNDIGNAITVDAIGNVYVTGKTTNNTSTTDYITVKYNNLGVQQWVKTFTGAGTNNDEAVAVELSANGRLYITGTTINASGNSDITTLRLNTNNGNTMWQKSINGSANDNDVAYSLSAIGNDVIVVGKQYNITTNNDYVTTKYNGNNGIVNWQKKYDSNNASNIATSLTQDASGNIAVTGTSLNGSTVEYHTVLYNANGIQQWINVNTTNQTFSSVTPKITVDPIANHFYVCGEKTIANPDILVYQITPSGNKTWEETFNGAQNSQDAAVDLVVNSQGIVYVAGASLNSNAKFDYTTVRISQTPVYFPVDLVVQTPNKQFTYQKNEGQIMNTSYSTATDVLFGTTNQYPNVYVQKNRYSYVFQKEDTVYTNLDTIERIDVNFEGSITTGKHYEFLSTGVNSNYYLGHATNQSITNLKGSERVFVPNYYPNIDLHYYSNKDGLKYYLVVKPNAKLEQIVLNIAGAQATSTNGNDELFIDGILGDVTLNPPLLYNVNLLGQAIPLTGNSYWNSNGGNNYSIKPAQYNTALPLVIQITSKTISQITNAAQANLDYSTYYGGSTNDVFNDIAIASNGDRYITGNTSSGLFPPVSSMNFYNGSTDVVLLKYTADDTLRYATFQGGSGLDFGNTVAVNSLNEVFIGGQTFSTDMYGSNVAGATNQFNNGGATSAFKADGFIAKMVSNVKLDDNTLVWRRYFGGSGSESIHSIYIDNGDNFYIAGYSSSTDCPVVNAFKSTLTPPSTANPANFDAVFGKFNSALTAQWITYYGGSVNNAPNTQQTDYGYDIVVDNAGNVIGCGMSDATDLATTNATGNTNTFFKGTFSGGNGTDGFFVRYNSAGNTVSFSSYFGGTNTDVINRLVFKSNLNEIYFAGTSRKGLNFPFHTKIGATNSQYNLGGQAAFLGYMDGNLTKQWCSYYGKGQTGTKTYNTTGLSVDSIGMVYLSGYTDCDTLLQPLVPASSSVYLDIARTNDDGFIAVFAPNKLLYHSHYFGGASTDRINNSAIARNQQLYVTGVTSSTDFPIAYNATTASLIDSTYNGGQDGFISRFKLDAYQIVGIHEIDFNTSSVLAYPNPSTQQFNIELKNKVKDKTTLKVYSTIGQLISEQTLTETITTINCQSWASGIYILNISNTNESTSFKLIKN